MDTFIVKRGNFRFKVWINEAKKITVARFVGWNAANGGNTTTRGPVGKAKCSSEDTYDRQTGVDLAVDRALIKLGIHWQVNMMHDFERVTKMVFNELKHKENPERDGLYGIEVCDHRDMICHDLICKGEMKSNDGK